MNPLRQIESRSRLRPRRVLLYGPRGVGLSTFAASLPKAVFVPADDSLDHLDCPRFPAPGRFDHVLRALGELYTEPHGYRTVVVDPLDALAWLIADDVRRGHGLEDADAALSATGARPAMDHWRALLGALNQLRDEGMTCALVGHERVERVVDRPGAGATRVIERRVPALEPRVSALVQSWCDAVLLACCGEALPDPWSTRRLCTTPARTHAAKNRLGLPPRVPMDPRVLAPYLAVPKHPLCS